MIGSTLRGTLALAALATLSSAAVAQPIVIDIFEQRYHLATITFEVGLGEAMVTTPGPNDLSTGLEFGYGTNFHAPWTWTCPGSRVTVPCARST